MSEEPRAPQRHAAFAAVLALAGTAAWLPVANPAGPPPGHTGGFGEPTCQICHIGSDVNAFGGRVRIEGLPERYDRGETYLLTVVLRAEETVLAGFQLAARAADGPRVGSSAGSFRPIDGRVAVTESETGQRYAHQTAEGAEVAGSSGSSWALEWTAPASTDPVVFHVAANSGNGDNSPLSDLVFTAEVLVPPLARR